MSDECWSAKTLNYSNSKISFDSVNIPSAEAAFALTNFCKKLEKVNLGFNFQIENIKVKSKEESDNLLRSIQKFPHDIEFSSIVLYRNETESESEDSGEDDSNSDADDSDSKLSESELDEFRNQSTEKNPFN